MYTNFQTVYGQELYHHGIKGQKWGVRRYQDVNGYLTPAGKERYAIKGQHLDMYQRARVTKANRRLNKAEEAQRKTDKTLDSAYRDNEGNVYLSKSQMKKLEKYGDKIKKKFG